MDIMNMIRETAAEMKEGGDGYGESQAIDLPENETVVDARLGGAEEEAAMEPEESSEDEEADKNAARKKESYGQLSESLSNVTSWLAQQEKKD